MSLKLYIDRDEILQKDTRHIELHDDGFSAHYGTCYFRWSKLSDKSCQICHTRPSCTIMNYYMEL